MLVFYLKETRTKTEKIGKLDNTQSEWLEKFPMHWQWSQCSGTITVLIFKINPYIINNRKPPTTWYCCHKPLILWLSCGISTEWEAFTPSGGNLNTSVNVMTNTKSIIIILYLNFNSVITCNYMMNQLWLRLFFYYKASDSRDSKGIPYCSVSHHLTFTSLVHLFFFIHSIFWTYLCPWQSYSLCWGFLCWSWMCGPPKLFWSWSPMLITAMVFILYLYFATPGRSFLVFLKSMSHFYSALKKSLYCHSVQIDLPPVPLSIVKLIISLKDHLSCPLLFKFQGCWVLSFSIPSLAQKYHPPISTTPPPPPVLSPTCSSLIITQSLCCLESQYLGTHTSSDFIWILLCSKSTL